MLSPRLRSIVQMWCRRLGLPSEQYSAGDVPPCAVTACVQHLFLLSSRTVQISVGLCADFGVPENPLRSGWLYMCLDGGSAKKPELCRIERLSHRLTMRFSVIRSFLHVKIVPPHDMSVSTSRLLPCTKWMTFWQKTFLLCGIRLPACFLSIRVLDEQN